MDTPTVVIRDEAGRSLTCYVEQTVELEAQEYLLLLPVDTPVELFAWADEDTEEPIPVEDEAEIERVFETAKAVLSEQLDLQLKRSAITLTVEGDLPVLDDSEEDGYNGNGFDEEGEEEEGEELQLLASFYHEEQEYTLYAPLDPFFILARLGENGEPQLLTEAELEKLEPLLPMLEDKLFDSLEE